MENDGGLGGDSFSSQRTLTSSLYAVQTVAGSGAKGFANGAPAAARFRWPAAVAWLPDGTLLVADRENHCVRSVSTSDGGASWAVRTFAGKGRARGFADGPVAEARFDEPCGLAVSDRGDVFVADSRNNRVRAIVDGTVTTIVGTGAAGGLDGAGVGIPGPAATLFHPCALALGPDDALFIAEEPGRVRILSRLGAVATLAGAGRAGFANGVGPAALFHCPSGIAVDAAGVVFVADSGNNRIRRITNGVVDTLAGSGEQGFADGAASAAHFDTPRGVALDAATGQLVIADTGNHRIRTVDPHTGAVATLAGSGALGEADGSSAAAASFSFPLAVVPYIAGGFLVADFGSNRIRYVRLKAGAVPLLPIASSAAAAVAASTITLLPHGVRLIYDHAAAASPAGPPSYTTAYAYIDVLRQDLAAEPRTYERFLDIMTALREQNIEVPEVVRRVAELFAHRKRHIAKFASFLPPGYRIEVDGLPAASGTGAGGAAGAGSGGGGGGGGSGTGGDGDAGAVLGIKRECLLFTIDPETRERLGACGGCGADAFFRCSRCNSAFYCGADCQRAVWPTHKPDCKSLRSTQAVIELPEGDIGEHDFIALDLGAGPIDPGDPAAMQRAIRGDAALRPPHDVIFAVKVQIPLCSGDKAAIFVYDEARSVQHFLFPKTLPEAYALLHAVVKGGGSTKAYLNAKLRKSSTGKTELVVFATKLLAEQPW